MSVQTPNYQVGYYPKLLPSLTAEWLERSIPVPGVMGSNPAVSGGFFQSNLWRRLAQCLDFNSACHAVTMEYEIIELRSDKNM